MYEKQKYDTPRSLFPVRLASLLQKITEKDVKQLMNLLQKPNSHSDKYAKKCQNYAHFFPVSQSHFYYLS